LYNYLIIHDIKYFFLNKINQTIRGGGQNFFSWEQITPPLGIHKNFWKSQG
jgi:hypothetical protein